MWYRYNKCQCHFPPQLSATSVCSSGISAISTSAYVSSVHSVPVTCSPITGRLAHPLGRWWSFQASFPLIWIQFFLSFSSQCQFWDWSLPGYLFCGNNNINSCVVLPFHKCGGTHLPASCPLLCHRFLHDILSALLFLFPDLS